MELNILLLGHTGMLGTAFEHYFQTNNIKYVTFTKAELDLTTDEAYINIDTVVDRQKITHIINCAGGIKSKSVSYNVIDMIRLNTLLPQNLKLIVEKYNIKLINYSTDCVFDGKTGFYSTFDKYTAHDVYGMSKALGEIGDSLNVLTIRTSIIGVERPGKSRSLISWLKSQNHINGYVNHLWSGVTTNYLAELTITTLLQKNGLITVACKEGISKYSLIRLICDRLGKKVVIEPTYAADHINRVLKTDIVVDTIDSQINRMVLEYGFH